MKKQLLSVVFLGLFLAGCGSSVKLDEVPVEDLTASTPPSATSKVEVQGIDSGQDSAQTSNPSTAEMPAEPGQGPVGVAHVVFFDFDSYVLRTEARSMIEAHAQFLLNNPQRQVKLEGHTDESGGREYNLALGQKRADAVRQALSLLGVTESQLEAISFGEEKLLSLGSSELEQAQNRRVEIRY